MDAVAWLILVGVAAVAGWLLAFGTADQIGVAGTLLGGVLGYLTATITERSRRKHEDAHRFEQERRAVYVRFIEAAEHLEEAIRIYRDALLARRENPGLADGSVKPVRPDFSPMEVAEAEIHLLAPREVLIPAVRVSTALYQSALIDDEDEWKNMLSTLTERKREFIVSAKSNLGTPRGLTFWQWMRSTIRERIRPNRPGT